MGIYREGDYTLHRLTLASGALYARVALGDDAYAVVNTPDVDQTIRALATAYEMHVQQRFGAIQADGVIVGVGCYQYSSIATVKHATSGRVQAWAVAEYLPLTARVLREDPSRDYQPVRRVVVSVGQVMLRHHKQDVQNKNYQREAAYRRLINYAGEAVLLRHLTEGTDTDV